MYTTGTGKITATTCMPVDDRYAKSKFKNQVLAQTDDVEMLEYILIGLIVVDLIFAVYRHYSARLQAVEQLAAINQAQNTPPIQRRDSTHFLRIAEN